MKIKEKMYVYTTQDGFNEIARMLRKQDVTTKKCMCMDGIERELLECSIGEFTYIFRNRHYMKVEIEFFQNPGHGIRPWLQPAN